MLPPLAGVFTSTAANAKAAALLVLTAYLAGPAAHQSSSTRCRCLALSFGLYLALLLRAQFDAYPAAPIPHVHADRRRAAHTYGAPGSPPARPPLPSPRRRRRRRRMSRPSYHPPARREEFVGSMRVRWQGRRVSGVLKRVGGKKTELGARRRWSTLVQAGMPSVRSEN